MIIRVVPETHLEPIVVAMYNLEAVFFKQKMEDLDRAKEYEKMREEIKKMKEHGFFVRKQLPYVQPAQKMLIIKEIKPDVVFLEFEQMLTPSQIKYLKQVGILVHEIDDLGLKNESLEIIKKVKTEIAALLKSGRPQDVEKLKKQLEDRVKTLGVERSKIMFEKMLRLISAGQFKRPLAFMGAAHAQHLKRWHPFIIWRVRTGTWRKIPEKYVRWLT